ncbi:VanZ family protein [Gynuella sunshinyii]|uniref:Putative integral membrane protein n=1 Tax=Gynuella sunshinyii YC6258 TaxID=1445510 RepID=A0A0C5VIK3_9GAMM|nr:VanZ family protein [Gynuella sunshinyii]AJQ94096.1 putative integral membrane protein [Gynuella sunshinyii YC6258]
MQKIIILITLLFVLFIARIIFLADTGGDSIFFDLGKAVPYGDKVAHFCLYGLLTLLVNWAFQFRQLSLYRWRPYLGSILVVVFAVLEELSQGWFPTRTLDIVDLLADAAGITVFSVISFWLQRTQQRYREN